MNELEADPELVELVGALAEVLRSLHALNQQMAGTTRAVESFLARLRRPEQPAS